MRKVKLCLNLDYIMGYLKYGHYEGELSIPDEDFDSFTTDPQKYIKEKDLEDSLKLVVDGYSVENVGDIYKASWEEI